MTVREILIDAACALGRSDIAEHLKSDNSDEVLDGECQRLLCAYNFAEAETAVCYRPLIHSQTIVVTGDYLAYTAFSKRPVNIEQVLKDGNAQKFTMLAEGLQTKSGKLEIVYRYAPDKKGFDDESEYKTGEEQALISGVAREYSLASGLYEQAVTWDKRYQAALAKLCQSKGGRLKMRRWI